MTGSTPAQPYRKLASRQPSWPALERASTTWHTCVSTCRSQNRCVCVSLSTLLPLIQPEQKETIRSFRQGHLNLLISTSVAEEGLDIPECNLVVRYGLLTNEIAQMQASGRARARNSLYSVVAPENGREVQRERTNEYLEELAGKAVAAVQDMTPPEFRRKVRAFPLCSPPPQAHFCCQPGSSLSR